MKNCQAGCALKKQTKLAVVFTGCIHLGTLPSEL